MSYNPDGNSRIGSSPNKLLGSALAFAAMFFALCISAFAQTTVTGRVTSSIDGEPLPSVNVLEVGTLNGTTTDLDGTFSIDVSDLNANLQFSFVGYLKQVVALNGRSEVNIVLEEDQALLDEVVVTALGLSREKKSLGYSVTEVSGESLTEAKDPNVINSLSGKVAGVVITRSTSGPGGGSRVLIRGNNSISGNNQPLYVVDGIPVDNSGFGSSAGNGTDFYRKEDFGTGISDLNPDDIESMSVLKGPNAAALYGSRAANGVILITTKKGTNRRGIGVEYNTNVAYDNTLILPEYQNEYGRGTNGSVNQNVNESGGSWGPKLDGTVRPHYLGTDKPFTSQEDNVKDFFDTGVTLINTLALQGGNEKSNIRFSYTNGNISSIIPNSGLNRNSFNVRGFTKFNDHLTVDAKVTYFKQESKNRPYQGTEGVMGYLYTIPRNVSHSDYADNYANIVNGIPSVIPINNGSGNPYWMLYQDRNEDTRERITGFAKATYNFTPDLSAFVRIGTDVVNQNIETVESYGHWYYPDGSINFRKYRTSESNADFLLMYNKELTEDFSVTTNVGGNMLYSTYELIGMSGRGFRIPALATLPSVGSENIIGTYVPLQEKKIHSLYGNASFSYRNFLYLDVSARNDWSSTLPKDNRSFFYPSASFSVLLNEFIDTDREILDFSKVRVSWAQVGNDTDPYQTLIGWNLGNQSYNDLTTLSRPSVRLNPDLKPENITSLEFGLEFKMLKNRVYGDLAYYSISSEDLIMDIPLPSSTGFSAERTNIGEMTNKGVEVMIGGTPIETRDFVWDLSFNFAKNKNEVKELIEGLDSYTLSSSNSGIRVQATAGGGFGDIYGYTYKRTDDGKLILNAEGIPLQSDDLVKLGNIQPDWTGGITNSFKYKGFSARFLIDIRYGGQLYSGTDASMDGAGVTKKTLEYRDSGVTVDGVINTGSSTNPVYEANTNQITAEQYWGAYSSIESNYIYDQTNVRLRELTVSYTLPKAMLSTLPITSATIGVTGRNLFFFTKDVDSFDPESSYSTSNFGQGILYNPIPTTRSIGFNLSLKF